METLAGPVSSRVSPHLENLFTKLDLLPKGSDLSKSSATGETSAPTFILDLRELELSKRSSRNKADDSFDHLIANITKVLEQAEGNKEGKVERDEGASDADARSEESSEEESQEQILRDYKRIIPSKPGSRVTSSGGPHRRLFDNNSAPLPSIANRTSSPNSPTSNSKFTPTEIKLTPQDLQKDEKSDEGEESDSKSFRRRALTSILSDSDVTETENRSRDEDSLSEVRWRNQVPTSTTSRPSNHSRPSSNKGLLSDSSEESSPSFSDNAASEAPTPLKKPPLSSKPLIPLSNSSELSRRGTSSPEVSLPNHQKKISGDVNLSKKVVRNLSSESEAALKAKPIEPAPFPPLAEAILPPLPRLQGSFPESVILHPGLWTTDRELVSQQIERLKKVETKRIPQHFMTDRIGEGNRSSVYRVALREGEMRALKLYNAAAVNISAVLEELELLADLRDHESSLLVSYGAPFLDGTTLAVEKEYFHFGNVRSLIDSVSDRIEVPHMVHILHDLLTALDFLHSHSIVHRHIRASSLWISPTGSIKLGNFSYAWKASAKPKSKFFADSSPYWTAPEVLSEMSCTAASDLWAVGCTIIEVLEKFPPHSDKKPIDAAALITQVGYQKFKEIKDLPSGLDQILSFCFAFDPSKRKSAKFLLSHAIFSTTGSTSASFLSWCTSRLSIGK